MKKTFLAFIILAFVSGCIPVIAAEVAETAPSAVEAVIAASAPSILDQVMGYVNSSAGVTILGAILVFILGKIFQSKPEWKTLYEKYFPVIMRGVKHAEKAIPDGTQNLALARADAALKFMIILEPKLASVNQTALAQAITMVHAAAETNENI